MKVLIVGGGGREHALGWKITQSPLLNKLFFAPGNPGTLALGQNITLSGSDLVQFAQDEGIDLVIVGPEAPLVDGIADQLAEVSIPCFGPKAAAARLEGSKAFSKEVMDATGVPTAAYETFTDIAAAKAYIQDQQCPIVVKADGLAGGKGVTICQNLEETVQALEEALCDKKFGEAGNKVVIEEFLEGTEVSFHMICDGNKSLPLITARDHKAHGEGGTGPNTGGMGTFAPNPLITPELAREIQDQVCEPIFAYMRDHGTPFQGVLFAGLMLTKNGAKVLEYNVRFGDPETQVMLPLLDYDLLPVLLGAAKGELPEGDFGFKNETAVCVVLTADGYPGTPRKGDAITGITAKEGQQVFHAGTKLNDETLVTNGGRVLGVTAWGADLEAARKQAYNTVKEIHFDGVYYRKDIGGSDV